MFIVTEYAALHVSSEDFKSSNERIHKEIVMTVTVGSQPLLLTD